MTPLIEDEGASHSIDTLIAAQLPAWAKNASVEALRSLRAALISEQHSAEQVRLLLGRVPDLADFCAPLLEKAILRKHGVRVTPEPRNCPRSCARRWLSYFPTFRWKGS